MAASTPDAGDAAPPAETRRITGGTDAVTAAGVDGAPNWSTADLATLLALDAAGEDVFVARRVDANMNGAVFGGQLIGQALLAAAATGVPPEAAAHSLQVAFLAPGSIETPMRYRVTRLLDGRRFASRHVLGVQGGRTIISANLSFQRPEPGPRFQTTMPAGVADPESLPTLGAVIERHAGRMNAAIARRLASSRTVELRPLDAEAFLFDVSAEGRFRYWARTRKPVVDGTPLLHHAALGYISDYWFPVTALAPHVGSKADSRLYVASLNHTMWFHDEVQADDWVFIDATTPFSGNSRGLTTGQFYRRDGRLVATAAQEGLQRGWIADGDGWREPR